MANAVNLDFLLFYSNARERYKEHFYTKVILEVNGFWIFFVNLLELDNGIFPIVFVAPIYGTPTYIVGGEFRF